MGACSSKASKEQKWQREDAQCEEARVERRAEERAKFMVELNELKSQHPQWYEIYLAAKTAAAQASSATAAAAPVIAGTAPKGFRFATSQNNKDVHVEAASNASNVVGAFVFAIGYKDYAALGALCVEWAGDPVIDRLPQEETEEALNISPFFLAAEQGGETAIRLLIAAGANVQVTDMYGYTALHRAACSSQEDNWRVSEILIAEGVPLLAENKAGDRASRLASNSGGENHKFLYEAELAAEAAAAAAESAVLAANTAAEAAAAATALEAFLASPQGLPVAPVIAGTAPKGFRFATPNKDVQASFSVASDLYNACIAQDIPALAQICVVWAGNPVVDTATVIMSATEVSLQALRLILAAGVNLEQLSIAGSIDRKGRTALKEEIITTLNEAEEAYAASTQGIEASRAAVALVKAGNAPKGFRFLARRYKNDPNAGTYGVFKATIGRQIILAQIDKDLATMTKLCVDWAGSDAIKKESEEALVCAAAEGQDIAVRLLFAAGASLSHQKVYNYWENDSGRWGCDEWDALHAAAYRGCHDTCRVLLELGADLRAKDNNGKTPLAVALEYKQEKVVKLLDELCAEAAAATAI